MINKYNKYKEEKEKTRVSAVVCMGYILYMKYVLSDYYHIIN